MTRVAANPAAMRALEVAERRLGTKQLSRRLSATDATLRAWRDGQVTMPQHRFLLLLDLLGAVDPDWQETDQGTS